MAFIQPVICSVEHAMTGIKQAFAKGPEKHMRWESGDTVLVLACFLVLCLGHLTTLNFPSHL